MKQLCPYLLGIIGWAATLPLLALLEPASAQVRGMPLSQLPVSPETLALEDLLLAGMERGLKGDYLGAIAIFSEVIRRAPDEVEAYYNRGLARYQVGDPTGAIADYDLAIRLRPDFAEAYAERGSLQMELGNLERALADLQQAAAFFQQQGNRSGYQTTSEQIRQLQQRMQEVIP